MKFYFSLIIVFSIHLSVFAVFPAVIPSEKPDFPMSIAMKDYMMNGIPMRIERMNCIQISNIHH